MEQQQCHVYLHLQNIFTMLIYFGYKCEVLFLVYYVHICTVFTF